MNLHKQRLQTLRLRGFDFLTIMDIGANVGQWYELARGIWPRANILSIEANQNCAQLLSLKNPNYQIMLLGDEETVSDFYVSKQEPHGTGASIYRENTKWYADPIVNQLEMHTLDSLGEKAEFIKIDVQGAELDVLRGGVKTIQEASFVELELSLMHYNEGAPLIDEVSLWMYEHGFLMYDILEHHYLNGHLNQLDVLFVNKRLDGLLNV